MMTKPSLILVDGSGFIFRAFHALPYMQNPQGTPVNAVYGFTNMLVRTLKDFPNVPIAVVFDVSRKTFRSDIYPQYKAQRPPPPDDLIPQFPLVREATKAFGVPAIELAGWEADDIIASYATALSKENKNCTIISSDKDLMQLVDAHVHMLDPIKQRPIDSAQVEKKFGVPPHKVVDVQALMGDSTDNVPGVPGIGPKTAAQLINTYSNLTNVLEAAPEMKKSKRRDMLVEHKDQALISLKLVTLDREVPLPVPLADLKAPHPDNQARQAWLQEMGFTSLVARLNQHAQGNLTDLASQDDTPLEKSQDDSSKPSRPFNGYTIASNQERIANIFHQIQQIGIATFTLAAYHDGKTTHLIGLAVGAGETPCAFIPLKNDIAPHEQAVAFEDLRAPLLAVLNQPSILKIFFDAKSQLIIFDRLGFPQEEIKAVDDVMIMSYAQSAGKYRHDLTTLANTYLHHVPSLPEKLGTQKKQKDFFSSSLDEVSHAVCEANDVTFRLWDILGAGLRENHALALYEYIERPLIGVLAVMEKNGIKINISALDKLSEEFAGKMHALEERIYKEAGQEFNLASPRQLGEILFDVMGLPGGKKTKSGAWKTDSKVLESLAQSGQELAIDILIWRKYAKLRSTYTEALPREADARHYLHTTFQMAVTSTGRLSSTAPNLQNIPVRSQEGEHIRQAFVAREGYKLISADYSQIELRLLAHVADIASLKDAFLHNRDIHAQTASEIFGIPLEEMDPETRRRAKAINFGIIYGISAFGLSQQLQIPQKQAKDYIERYFERYPGIQKYMDDIVVKAEAHGYVETPFGRRCYIPEIKARNKMVRQYAQRQAINAPLQGGSADIIKKAMVKLGRILRREDIPQTTLRLQVHDELLLEAPQEHAQTVADIVKETMEKIVKLSVPLKVDTGIGDNWAQAH